MVKMNNVDWPAIGAEVIAGAKSVRRIAREHGVSHTAIQKRVEKNDWAPHVAAEATQAAPEQSGEVAKPAATETGDAAPAAARYGLDMVSVGGVSEMVSVETPSAEAAATGKVRTEIPSTAGVAVKPDNGRYGVQFTPEARSINGATTTGNTARWRYGTVTSDDCLIWTELYWKPEARQWQPG